MEEKYRIGELAEKADVTRRTIHYYLSRGLLPASEGAGVGTYYSDEHLHRILLIKKYQENYLPLDEIKKILSILTLDEVKEKLENNESLSNYQVLEAPSTYDTVNVYKKKRLDFGVEIHYPMDNPKAEEVVSEICKLVEKFNREA